MKMRPSGISTKPVRNLRMTALALLEAGSASGAGLGRAAVAVQSFAHFLAGLEKRNAFLIDRNMRAGTRIASGAGRAMLDRKCAETAQLDPVAARQGSYDLIENRVDDIL